LPKLPKKAKMQRVQKLMHHPFFSHKKESSTQVYFSSVEVSVCLWD